MKSVSDIARIFQVDKGTVKRWAYEFREFLSPKANPPKGTVRCFNLSDIMVLALINAYWEENPDLENIRVKLNCEEQYEDRYVRIAYLNMPLFQDVSNCESMYESWQTTVVLGGLKISHERMSLAIAESYKTAGDEMVRIAIESKTAYEMAYPILFMYRHAIEVYLKVLLPEKDKTHNFSDLISTFQLKCNVGFAEWAIDRLIEFQQVDPYSDAFRYANSKTPLPNKELTVDLRQVRVVVDHICTGLKNLILKSDIPPAYTS